MHSLTKKEWNILVIERRAARTVRIMCNILQVSFLTFSYLLGEILGLANWRGPFIFLTRYTGQSLLRCSNIRILPLTASPLRLWGAHLLRTSCISSPLTSGYETPASFKRIASSKVKHKRSASMCLSPGHAFDLS